MFYLPTCFRKFFGWKTITINMILYLLFVIPLTVLAVMERANEKRLCNINESWTRKVILEIRYRYLSQCHSGRCQVRDLIY